jgi:hypothetical protein
VSYVAFFAWVVASTNRFDRKIDSLDAKLSTQIKSLDERLSAEIGNGAV